MFLISWSFDDISHWTAIQYPLYVTDTLYLSLSVCVSFNHSIWFFHIDWKDNKPRKNVHCTLFCPWISCKMLILLWTAKKKRTTQILPFGFVQIRVATNNFKECISWESDCDRLWYFADVGIFSLLLLLLFATSFFFLPILRSSFIKSIKPIAFTKREYGAFRFFRIQNHTNWLMLIYSFI